MKISVLDAATLGGDIEFSCFEALGEVEVYDMTKPEQVAERMKDCDVVIVNKIKLNETNLDNASKLKLICVAATGYDNIDINYCRGKGIAVCNVVGYSTHCVAQVTVAMVLSLVNHLTEYDRYVSDGSYTASGVNNCLIPVYHELCGKTWGIVGAGNIGGQVAKAAQAFGCNVIVYKRTKSDKYNCVDLDTLLKNSDVVSIHLPLNDDTRKIISAEKIALMKSDAIIVNVARGDVWDEEAVADAVMSGKIGALGCDVYSAEPMSAQHPFNKIMHLDNVCLTPHMAWGGYESRVRCMKEIVNNIRCFFDGVNHNRIV